MDHINVTRRLRIENQQTTSTEFEIEKKKEKNFDYNNNIMMTDADYCYNWLYILHTMCSMYDNNITTLMDDAIDSFQMLAMTSQTSPLYAYPSIL